MRALVSVLAAAALLAGLFGVPGVSPVRIAFAAGPDISINDVAVVEGDSGTVEARFNVALQFKPTTDVLLTYSTGDGTATQPGDYTPAVSAVITIPPTIATAANAATIVVPVTGDDVAELDETFTVNLVSATGGSTDIVDNQGVGHIVNDDDGDTPLAPFPSPDGDPVIAAAGDISCPSRGCKDDETARLISDVIQPDAVLGLGDYQYETGTLENMANFYHLDWGRLKPKMFPVSGGSHDFYGRDEYITYFNTGGPVRLRPEASYSYDLGEWHIVALNSYCWSSSAVECDPDAVTEWLTADLAENPSECTLAYFHEPYWTTSTPQGHDREAETKPWVEALYAAGADVILQAHNHFYERFAPQTPDDVLDEVNGIQSFTVGTGGRSFYRFDPALPVAPNSVVRNDNTFGVLKMTLKASSYSWEFVPEAALPGAPTPAPSAEPAFTDSGSRNCSRPATPEPSESPSPLPSESPSPSPSESPSPLPSESPSPSPIPPPNISISDAQVTEGAAGSSTNAQFTVSLSAATDVAVSFLCTIDGGTATQSVDYLPPGDDAHTIPAGETTATVGIAVLGDAIDEDDETFAVGVSATGATVTDGQATGTIVDDDAAPSVTVADVTLNEGETKTSAVSLSGPSGKQVSVTYATVDGSATAPPDYTARSGTLVFAAGDTSETISLDAVIDGEDEPAETYSIVLSSPENATLADSVGAATIATPCTVLGTAANDLLAGTLGDDVICGFGGNDTIEGRGGNDYIRGGPGIDRVSYVNSASAVSVNLGTSLARGTTTGTDMLAGIEHISGSVHNDALYGDAAANDIRGGWGNDTLVGGGGNDALFGQDGIDRLDGQAGNDRLDGGNGIDLGIFTSATSAVTVSLPTGATSGGAGSDRIGYVENVYGSQHSDRITGTTGANSIWGSGGNDVIFGNAANDSIVGGAGNDTVYAHAGTDTIYGQDGADYLDGGADPDRIYGEAGNDRLYGGAGTRADAMNGGTGTDRCVDGSGARDYRSSCELR